jgi:hypothetical protein
MNNWMEFIYGFKIETPEGRTELNLKFYRYINSKICWTFDIFYYDKCLDVIDVLIKISSSKNIDEVIHRALHLSFSLGIHN